MLTLAAPGVHKDERLRPPPPALRTGVPAFLGLTAGAAEGPQLLGRWPELAQRFGPPAAGSYLRWAVRGFFDNGGRRCYVVPLAAADRPALARALERAESLDADLLCAPDLALAGEAMPELQQQLLDHCRRAGAVFAVLDSRPAAGRDGVLAQRRRLRGADGALYFPWVRVPEGPEVGFVPPCGQVAGVYARSDQHTGVHKAPAGGVLEGVLDLELDPGAALQGELNPRGVNCLRAFPGRGIRVWGARTLSDDPSWTYVNVRRIFLTAGRWIERHLADAAFEPNDPRLWAAIRRDLTFYCDQLHRRGALRGSTATEAFYVRCDAETNPPAERQAGRVVTEIGLAAAVPGEFVVVRILHRAGGVTLETGPPSLP